MKHFSILLHFVLTFWAVGLAVGSHLEGFRPLVQCECTGLAVGLGMSFVIRVFMDW